MVKKLTQLQAHALAEPVQVDVLTEPPFYVQVEEGAVAYCSFVDYALRHLICGLKFSFGSAVP